MKKLVLGTLLTAGLLQAGTGCIISGDDDDDDVTVDDGDDGVAGLLYEPSWLCPPDAETITINVVPVGSSTGFEDNFDCAVGEASIQLDAGSYDATITPEGSIGTFLELTDSFDGNDGDLIAATYDTFPEDAGYFFLTWTIDGEDPAVACDELASAGVGVLSTLVGTADATDDTFDCDAGQGLSTEVPIGDYTVEVSLLDQDELAIDSFEPTTEAIDFGDQLNDLGDYDFSTL
ncbi:MAG TPA: hypothetical protein VK698_07200 [Kofleriaceae bacterium]|nr:hypothetical protein [Kofleriaceae bacterium]